MFTTFDDLPYLEIGKQTIRAFLLAARRSRRAMGYAIASVLGAPCVQARMPSACLTQIKYVCFWDFLRGRGFAPPSHLFANYSKTIRHQKL